MIVETLSNFVSIYCFIAFIIGACFMLAMLSSAAMGKTKESKVHFYIKRVHDGFELWLKDTSGCYTYVTHFNMGSNYMGFNIGAFMNMKYDDMREVKLIED